MRVYCTSVEETINAKDIEKSLKKYTQNILL